MHFRGVEVDNDSPSKHDDDKDDENDDDDDVDVESRQWQRRYNSHSTSLHSSFLHHSSHPLSPIKSLAPQSRVFARPRLDRASVVSFLPSEDSFSADQQQQQQHQQRRRQLSSLYDDKNKLEYMEQCFEVEAKIGEGSFGEVFKARSKEDGKYYAIKRSRGAFRGTSDRKEKLGEVAKLEKMKPHPNCVEFFLAWEEKKHLYIQTEVSKTPGWPPFAPTLPLNWPSRPHIRVSANVLAFKPLEINFDTLTSNRNSGTLLHF